MENKIDHLLKQALTPNEEPDFWMNEKLKRLVKENQSMKNNKRKKIPAVILTAVLVLCFGSITAFAAWKYLAPDSVSQAVKDSKLAAAFQSEDAVRINETQTFGNVDVTLLGMVSGKDITDHVASANGKLIDNQTYSVVAISNTDGTPMPAISDDAYGNTSYFVSPLINGYDPAQYNAVTMHGGYQDIVEDGILYRISACDNIEAFADHEIYLCVSDSTFYNVDAYNYDSASGAITRNDSYSGINALFTLPLDPNQADPATAAAYLQQLKDEAAADDSDEYVETDVDQWMDQVTPENIDEYAAPIESTRQILTPDANGSISTSYDLPQGSGSGTNDFPSLFPDNQPGMSASFSYSYGDDGLADLLIQTFTLNEDGTVTYVVYAPKL